MDERNLLQEAERQLVICNACRYCEGFCPVFRAIETRRDFKKGDVFYLANLCHDCRACYYACMYSPPHEFAVNIPQIMAAVRPVSYRSWSWPAFLARSFTDRGRRIRILLTVIAIVIVSSVFLIPTDHLFSRHLGPGAFYQIVPYLAMVIPAILLFLYWMGIWSRGTAGFVSDVPIAPSSGLRVLAKAAIAAIGLKYLGGGGPGCTYPEQRPSSSRRFYHLLVFWGFLSDLASTCAAAIYQDVLHRQPPYQLSSLPVVLGSLGGVALIIGTAGLIYLKMRSDPAPAAKRTYGMDYAFLVTLGLAALSGMLTLIVRTTQFLGSLLILHLALVAALFLTAPYGKFVHALYRSLALIKYYVEQERKRYGVEG
jgi:citrate/tricarballylate utilization protein